MQSRLFYLVFSLIIFSVTLIWAVTYGPAKRTYTPPPRQELVASPPEILAHWESSDLKGRIAVVFTRRLNAGEPNTDWAEIKYLQQAMHRGIVRKVFHVVPDAAWAEVNRNLAKQRMTPAGRLILYDEGRVVVTPLSNFRQRYQTIGEQVLAVVEPSIWTEHERAEISMILKNRPLTADLVAFIGGTAQRSLPADQTENSAPSGN